ncbi:unnamed protein product [Haemonchus placei]|uniref:Uncharacterized protein n=1 Tax=Haemonchus placei TaxID=6290 RepID=A0A0N4WJ13_HAEPC|nr:unnamed protein product [Haemonchus placei]
MTSCLYVTPDIEQAEQMLVEFDNACVKVEQRLNLKKTMFMRNGLVPDASSMLNGTKSLIALATRIY